LSHAQNGGPLRIARGGRFYVAFSRDQLQNVYVQQKMRKQSQTVWDFLFKGACVSVASSATKMPSDVMSAMVEIISEEAGFSRETAVLQLRRLEKVGRYHVEAWS
jgi:sulfite reductase alpha subunit-like flavoprotein